MLVFACITLTAANGILYSMIPTIYWDEDLIVNHHHNSQAVEMTGSITAFSAKIRRYQQLEYSHLTLVWTTVIAVKFCFLLFFRQLVDRQHKLVFIWKIVFGITLPFYLLCACAVFISCPHFGIDACTSNSSLAGFLWSQAANQVSFYAVSKMCTRYWIQTQLHNGRPGKYSGHRHRLAQ